MKSTALPRDAYQDPETYVANKELKELGCRACDSSVPVGSRVGCSEPRKTDQKGIPHIGSRCKFFKLKG